MPRAEEWVLNSRMSQELDLAGPITAEHDLAPKLIQLVDEGFVESKDCVFFKRFAQLANRVNLAEVGDKTGLECFVNHVHVGDVSAPEPSNDVNVLRQAVAFGSLLAKQLVLWDARQRPFEIVVAGIASDTTVRFHLMRNGENYLGPDLETYTEPVLLIRTSGGGPLT